MSVTLTPLLPDDEGLACYLLEIGECVLLLDCGWDERFNPEVLEPLAAATPRVDAVLLTHGDLAHVGGLPYAMASLGLSAPVYATLPVSKMAQMHLYDAYASAKAVDSSFDTFDLDAVDAAFGGLRELKFAQPTRVTGHPSSITIAPHAAGHTIGGCFWRITSQAEEVLYVPEYNHQKERHLPGGALDQFARPSVLIIPARNTLQAHETRREKLTAEFVGVVKAAVTRGGDVLLPTDAAGRSLELLSALEHAWRSDRRLNGVPIVFLHRTAFNALEFAKSQIEWMGDDAVHHFDVKRENPMAFRHVHTRHDLASVAALPSPKVILATSSSLERGFASELLVPCCAQPSALLLFTQRPRKGTLAARLLTTPPPQSLTLPVRERRPLSGEALALHEQAREARRAERAADIAASETAELVTAGTVDHVTSGPADKLTACSSSGASSASAASAYIKVVKAVEVKGDATAEGATLSVGEAIANSQPVALKRMPSSPRAKLPALRSKPSPAAACGRLSLLGGPVSRYPMLPYVEAFTAGDEWGKALGEDEWKAMEDGANALFAFDGNDLAARLRGGAEGGNGAHRRDSAAGSGTLLGQKRALDEATGSDGEDEDEGPLFTLQTRPEMSGETLPTDADAEEEAEEESHTMVERQATVEVRCSVRFVDMEGVSDGRSIKTIVTRLAPRKIVVVRADEESKQRLAQYFTTNALPNQAVITPTATEAVDVGSGSSLYSLKLADELVRGLSPYRLGDYEISRIHGTLAVPSPHATTPTGGSRDIPRVDASWLQRKGLAGVLEPDPEGCTRGTVHFLSHGDLRLAEFKQLLGRSGYSAEFMDGALIVNSTVRVRRSGLHKLLLEGSYGSTYMNVRKLLYDQFELV